MRLSFLFDGVANEGDLRVKISKKIAQIDKYLKGVSSDLRKGIVKLSKEKFDYKVKVDLKIPGSEVLAETKSKNLLSAVDQVVNKLKSGIIKKRGKTKNKLRV